MRRAGVTGFAVLALPATAAAQSPPARPHASSWRVPALHGVGLPVGQRVAASLLWTRAFSLEDGDRNLKHLRAGYTQAPVFDPRRPLFEWDGDRWEINDLRGSGHLDTGARERTRANLMAMLGDNRVRLSHTTTMHGDEPHTAVHLAMPSSAGALDSLPTIVQASWAGATSSHFDFTATRD